VGAHGRRAGAAGAVPTRSPAARARSTAAGGAAVYKQELVYTEQIRGASIYPAVQNIILACRAFGLGTLITTNHIRCEEEVKVLLGIPDDVSTYALMPIGYPENKFGPVKRRPVNEVAYSDRWGTPWRG
jgi:nitroreductase